MPRAYDVNSISSDELRLNKIDFRIQYDHLEEEYANSFTRWSSLIRRNADQELIDREEKQYKNIQRQKTLIYNKMTKTDYELQRRIKLEFR